MFASEHEARYTTRQNPHGGITPTRYALALDQHAQKQMERRRFRTGFEIAPSINSLLRSLSDWGSSRVSKHLPVFRAR